MRRLAHHVAVAMALLAVLAAAAVALVHSGGWPPPHDLPDPSRVSGPAAVHPAIIAAGFALGWLAWAAALASVVTRTVTGIGGALAALPRLRLPGPLQTLSATLLGTVAVTTATTQAAAAAPPSAAATLPADHPTVSALHLTAAADRIPVTVQTRSQRHSYTVHRGDNLSHIAAAWLGSADRWPEIYHLNQGRHFPQVGGALTNPNLIYPGWTLVLPDDARPPGQSPPAAAPSPAAPSADPTPPAPAPAPSQPATPPPTSPPTSPPTPGSSAAASARPSATAGPAASASASAVPSPSRSASPAPSPDASSTTPATGNHQPTSASRDVGVRLPGGWVPIPLAAALIAAAALVWLRRRHRYVPGKLARPVLSDPDLQPLPPAVTVLRRGVRRHAPDLLTPQTEPAREAADDVPVPATPPPTSDGTVVVLPPIGPSV